MDALEKQLYSDVVNMPESEIKDIDKVFGDTDFADLDISRSGSEGDPDNSEYSESTSDSLRHLGEGQKVERDFEEIKIAEILNNPEKAKQEHKVKTSRMDIIADIVNYKSLLKERDISVPDQIKKITKKPESKTGSQLIEARNLLRRMFNNSETSEVITEMQMNVIGFIAMIFQGKINFPFTRFKLNLTGYPQHLRRKMHQITNQNIKIAGVINDRVGEDIIEAVKFFSLYISPLITVIAANHGPASLSDIGNYDDLSDSDNEEENSSESDSDASSSVSDSESDD